MILHENGQCLLGTKKLEIMPNVGVEIFLSLPITFPVIVNVNACQIKTNNTQISFFEFFQPNLVHYRFYKKEEILLDSPQLFGLNNESQILEDVLIFTYKKTAVIGLLCFIVHVLQKHNDMFPDTIKGWCIV